MRAVVVALLLAARVAAADDDPIDLPLADAPVEIADHFTLRPLAHSTLDAAHARLVFDGPTRLVMTWAATGLRDGPDLTAKIARSLAREPARIAKARIEPFGVTSGLTAFAVLPDTPARANELIVAAFVAGNDGVVDRLSFYVEDDAKAARDLSWRATAQRIVRTVESTLPVGHATRGFGPWVIDLPRAAGVFNYTDTVWLFRIGDLRCSASVNPDATDAPAAPSDVFNMVLGQAVIWHVAADGRSESARVDTTAVACVGNSATELAYGRSLLATLAVAP